MSDIVEQSVSRIIAASVKQCTSSNGTLDRELQSAFLVGASCVLEYMGAAVMAHRLRMTADEIAEDCIAARGRRK